MNVEPERVRFTFCPRDNVKGTQQSNIRDPGQRAPAIPVFEECIAKYVLSDPLDDQPFRLRCSWKATRLLAKLTQRAVRQTSGEPIRAIEGVIIP
jgi:hypothetical protein